MAGLTTHVLDTARGRPAAGMALELAQLGENGRRRLLKSVRTNAEGRTDEPLLSEEESARGYYEILFEVGEYFAGRAEAGDELPFLDRVPLRFGISNPSAHYHVPLLVSPWSYSTYRGS